MEPPTGNHVLDRHPDGEGYNGGGSGHREKYRIGITIDVTSHTTKEMAIG